MQLLPVCTRHKYNVAEITMEISKSKLIIIIFMHWTIDRKLCCASNALAYSYPGESPSKLLQKLPPKASIRVNSRVTCVGAILNRCHVVTLCDCVEEVQETPSQVTVRVGITSNDSMIVKAVAIYCHENFTNDILTPDMNIAVIKTKPFTLGASVKRVTLPDITLNQTKSIRSSPPTRPTGTQSFIMVGWMLDKHYYTLKTDPGMRTWITFGKVGYLVECLKSREIADRFAFNMFCAEFYHRDGENCSADRGTLMMQSGLLWGMMSYKYANCGGYLSYFPYIDISQHLNFIVNAVHGNL